MNENWLYVNKIHDHKIIYKFSFPGLRNFQIIFIIQKPRIKDRMIDGVRKEKERLTADRQLEDDG